MIILLRLISLLETKHMFLVSQTLVELLLSFFVVVQLILQFIKCFLMLFALPVLRIRILVDVLLQPLQLLVINRLWHINIIQTQQPKYRKQLGIYNRPQDVLHISMTYQWQLLNLLIVYVRIDAHHLRINLIVDVLDVVHLLLKLLLTHIIQTFVTVSHNMECNLKRQFEIDHHPL